MSELKSYIDDTFNNLKSKIEEEYNNKIKEHFYRVVSQFWKSKLNFKM
jgi:hypothetical protein